MAPTNTRVRLKSRRYDDELRGEIVTFLAQHNSARYHHGPGSPTYLTVKVTAVVCVTDPDAEIVTV
jgi:hypothetical protein